MEPYLIYLITGLSIVLIFLVFLIRQWRLNYLAYLQKQIRKKWKNAHYNSLRGNFVVIYDTPIEERYNLNKEKILGQGSFGIVVVGINKETGIKYAIKFINKSCDEVKRLEREVKLLKDVDHINIVGLFAVYETNEQVGFVMELCTGGHLGRFLEKLPDGHVKEDHAKSIIRQLLSAIAHMHARGICHRDIKLQNILMENQSMNSQIKLIDFGFGTRFIGATPLKTRCGTPYTTAPEVFQESYDERCDVWSAGVVAYTTICGRRPFQALVLPGELENAGKASLVTNILMCRYHFNYPHWKVVSTTSIDFIQKMLHPDYKMRWHAKEALRHEWLDPTGSLARKQEKYKAGFHMEGLDRVLVNLKRTSVLSSLHKTSMLAVVFSQPQQSEKLRALFQDFDTDHNGTLSIDEFTAAIKILSNNRISEEDARRLFEAIDVNHDEQISFTEFLAATLDPREVDPEALNKAFDLLDVEKKGYITASDLERVMDAKYRRNRKMSEKINAKVANQASMRSITQKDSKIFTSTGGLNENIDDNHHAAGEAKFLPMSKFNFLKKARSIKPEQSGEDSGVSMDSDLSRSMDHSKGDQRQRKSFSLAKSFLQIEEPPDEDDDIIPTALDLKKTENIEDVFDPVIAQRIREIFVTCDVNHDGVISYSEFLWAMADGDGKFKQADKSGSDSSEEEDLEKLKLRRGSSMPVIRQDENTAKFVVEQSSISQQQQQQQQQLQQQHPQQYPQHQQQQQPQPSPSNPLQQSKRRNTSFVIGHEGKPPQPQNSNPSRLETIISRAPTQGGTDQLESSLTKHCTIGESDPLDMSVSSLLLEKDELYSSLSSMSTPFYFDRKFSDSNLDSDLEMGSKSSVSSRGRLVGSLTEMFNSQPKKEKKRNISEESLDSLAPFSSG